jgi:NTP pyrophosphatase (non-canonical NTP hydrolase)
MTNDEYIRRAVSTEFPADEVAERLHEYNIARLTHAILGIVTESGELADILKKYIAYDKQVDYTHMKEELGDLLYYIAIALSAVGTSFEQIMRANTAKLNERYKSGPSQQLALLRDLSNERDALKRTLEE